MVLRIASRSRSSCCSRRFKGVGAKSASDIISRVDKIELLRRLAPVTCTSFRRVRGIGRKTAERIVVELKDKVAEFAQEEGEMRVGTELARGGPYEDALQALMALGFGAGRRNGRCSR